MAKFPLYQWKKATGNGDTTGLAKLNANNTFTGKNTFENTGDVVAIKRTDNQSFGIVFKKEDGDRVGYIGTSESDTNKATVWGATGLKLQTTNSPIEITPGTAALTYTSSNTAKDRREVLVRNDLYYIRKVNSSTRFNVPANGYQSAQFDISGIARQSLNEFLVIITTSSVDITLDFKIYVNSVAYPNMSDIKTVSISNWKNENIDARQVLQVGFIVTDTNKIRYRMKNLSGTEITFTSIRIFHRVPGKIDNN